MISDARVVCVCGLGGTVSRLAHHHRHRLRLGKGRATDQRRRHTHGLRATAFSDRRLNPLRARVRINRQRQPGWRRIIVSHCHGHIFGGDLAIVVTLADGRDRVRDDDGALVIRVVDMVVDGRDGDSLRPIPVAGGERQASRRDRGDLNGAALDPDFHRAGGGLGIKHDGVGADVLGLVWGRGIVELG